MSNLPKENNCVLIRNPDLLPKLTEVLSLIYKYRKKGAFKDYYSIKFSHIRKSRPLGKNFINVINDCLLNHRFNEAAKLLWVMCQDRCCFNLVLYKAIRVVLDNLISNDEIETVNQVTRDCRKLNHVNKLEIQLEYLIEALKNDINGTEDSYFLEGKNLRRNIKLIPHLEQLFTAYTALINYITWVKSAQNEELVQSNKDFASTIILSFKQLINNPGIWDIFVLKLIEMLEYYEQYDELEDILKKYVELNPKHVNAYIYLCVHLHKHNTSSDAFIQYAKTLSKLCPSDERVLLLVQKWDELGKNLKKSLKILFAFLDYPINGRSIQGWQLLAIHLYKAISSNVSSLIELVNSSWEMRSSSWSYMHFKLPNIKTDAFELVQWKVKVLLIVQSDHEYIKKAKKKLPAIQDDLLHYNEGISPTTEDIRSTYKLNADMKNR